MNNVIDESASIGKGTKIGYFATVHKNVSIGENCKIEDGAKIYDGCIIGDNCIIGINAVLRPNTRIGNNTIFGTGSVSEGWLSIGNDTSITTQCHITRGSRIGDNVFIGPFFVTTNTPSITEGKHGNNPKSKLVVLGPEIEDNVRIGGSVRVIPGRKIGHDSLIDMDVLITKDVPPFSHVRGSKPSLNLLDESGKIIGKL